MSEQMRCLYAEMIGAGKKLTSKIVAVRDSPDPLYCNGQKTGAWDISIEKKDKDGNTLYIQIPKRDKHGKSTALLRQFITLAHGDPSDKSIGLEITFYTISSNKSATGLAIRIAIPEHAA